MYCTGWASYGLDFDSQMGSAQPPFHRDSQCQIAIIVPYSSLACPFQALRSQIVVSSFEAAVVRQG